MSSFVFADTYYYLVALNPNDAGHGRALEFGEAVGLRVVTSEWILLEIADAMADAQDRRLAIRLFETIRSDAAVRVVPIRRGDFESALQMYENRPDKGWSLTDCTSFLIMQRSRLTKALTADRHFAQAGFEPLLA